MFRPQACRASDDEMSEHEPSVIHGEKNWQKQAFSHVLGPARHKQQN